MSNANSSGSLGTTQLLAFLTDPASIEAVRAAAITRGIKNVEVKEGGVAQATKFLSADASPEVLIVDVPSAETAPKLLDALADVVNPHTRVIVSGKIDTLSFYQWLMGLGIHDYLLQPFTEAQLSASLDKGTAPSATASSTQEKKFIAVIGARGGVGATTIATHLAAILAKEHHHPTALVDLDLHFGSVALSLDLEPSRGLRDALEKPDRVDTLFLERVMVKPSADFSILSAEESLAEQINVQPNAGELLFGALAEQFLFIVADLPRQVSPLTRYVLAQADHVIVVMEPNLASLRDALRLKDLLTDTLKRPAPIVIVNRIGLAARHELSRGDLTKHYGEAAAFEIPYAAEAFGAMSRGETLLENPKGKPLTDPLRRLAARFSDKEIVEEEKKGAFGFLGQLLKARK